jgi:hypothetical protein
MVLSVTPLSINTSARPTLVCKIELTPLLRERKIYGKILKPVEKEESMKRMILSWGIILLTISVALVSYAKMEKIAITKDNLTDLKGNWIGSRSIGPGDARNTDLEIYNDVLPVKGKFVLYGGRKKASEGTKTINFNNGKINDQGNLLIEGSNLEAELSFYKDDGMMKLEGDFSLKVGKGTMSFKKK